MRTLREDVEISKKIFELIVQEEEFEAEEFDVETLKLLREIDALEFKGDEHAKNYITRVIE